MNPKPLVALNHFTVPVGIVVLSGGISDGASALGRGVYRTNLLLRCRCQG